MSEAASATSSRSCATYSSPALVAACCAASSTRTSSGVSLRLAGARALTFGCAGDFGVHRRRQRRLRVAARGPDQTGGGAFLVIQQRLQQVLGGDPLVEFAYRDGAGGLEEALRTFGEFLNVHVMSLSSGDSHPVPRQEGGTSGLCH